MTDYTIHQIANHEVPIVPPDASTHMFSQLSKDPATAPTAETKFGAIKGGRIVNSGTCAWLSVPYALPAKRWEDPKPLPPDYRYDSSKQYITDDSYCPQTKFDGQAPGTDDADKCGFGKQNEDVLFVNIVAPFSAFPKGQQKKSSNVSLPVNVYIHGGFLQWGGPAGLKAQSQYVSEERQQIRINIGYRLNIFGFMAAQKPYLPGNYGFKDQWIALKWIKENVAAFGGE